MAPPPDPSKGLMGDQDGVGARSPSPAPRVQLASSRTELTMTYVQGDNSNFPNYVTILLRRNVPEC
jgi:hypothetical protein